MLQFINIIPKAISFLQEKSEENEHIFFESL
ncbi:hypothetical protein SGO_1188 [Streptococcus gordonii str. Challis substr. CH1]|uniref:Uncharacterized protein n=1 Tax=Streptococcus gordonii (strain Challis / ATCC 35105 / BCRC 15272 / CH1 / DL1 / V288) TaxID=467705 RepID=A8AXG5_STRGC|nr:hypothetical protein SGO_1188 [Streptococcus gordonii str. Challis substr. CH1]